jgi:uncharacterized repeat protein (TIGR01451 family)
MLALSQPEPLPSRSRRHRRPRKSAWPARAVLSLSLAAAGVTCARGDLDPQNAAVATGSGPLETTIQVERLLVVPTPAGETRHWVAAGRLAAGDEVHYTVRVHNPGKEPVTDVVVTKRLPFGVHYRRDSAVGPACIVQFSADGGVTFAPPERVRQTTRKPPAPSYTHVRWILRQPLSPGATALLRFRATFT